MLFKKEVKDYVPEILYFYSIIFYHLLRVKEEDFNLSLLDESFEISDLIIDGDYFKQER